MIGGRKQNWSIGRPATASRLSAETRRVGREAKMGPWHSSRVIECQGGRRRGVSQDGGWAGSSASCPEPHRIPTTSRSGGDPHRNLKAAVASPRVSPVRHGCYRASPVGWKGVCTAALRGEMRMTGRRLCAQIRAIVRSVGNARSSSRIEAVERPLHTLCAGWRVRSWSSGRPLFWCVGTFQDSRPIPRSLVRRTGAPARADTGFRPAPWVAPGRITRERTCRCQRPLIGRPAYLMEPGGMMTRASAMLAADVAATGRQEAT